jgi:hypothetical protein
MKGRLLVVIVGLSALVMVVDGMLGTPSESVASVAFSSREGMSSSTVGVDAGDEGVTLFSDDFNDIITIANNQDLRDYRRGGRSIGIPEMLWI